MLEKSRNRFESTKIAKSLTLFAFMCGVSIALNLLFGIKALSGELPVVSNCLLSGAFGFLAIVFGFLSAINFGILISYFNPEGVKATQDDLTHN